MIRHEKTSKIIIREGQMANPYNFECNSMRRGNDSEVTNHKTRGKYKVGSLLEELTEEEREELKSFNSEILSRTEKEASWKLMEFIGKQNKNESKKGRWGLK